MSARGMRRHREREREAGRLRRRSRRIATGAGVAIGAAAIFAPAAHGDTFPVDTTDDGPDDGDCFDDDCTLREAINEADANSGDDVVTFAAGLSGEIELTDGDISIGGLIGVDSGGVEIQGPGAEVLTVDGQGIDRIFKILGFSAPNEQVVISGLTLTGGDDGDGGAIQNQGLIDPGNFYFFPADLTIANSVITDNEASGNGGAIHNEPVSVVGSYDSYYAGGLTIQGSVISDNEAGSDGGAIVSESNGYGPVTIADSVISGNRADYVGGVKLEDLHQQATITRTTVSDNTAVGSNAGGIGVDNQGGTAGFTIESSTISGNRADGRGGGMQLWVTDGPVTVRNTTISGNVAEGGDGGGIYSNNDSGSERSVLNSTIVGNSADDGGGVALDSDSDETLEIRSTVVANNFATEEGPDLSRNDSDGVFELGFSLVESTAGSKTIAETPAGSNIFGVDPQLGGLASNGGPTQTHLPAATSPALDQGVANGLTSDQRGLARTSDSGLIPNPVGGDGTDIGAVEIQVSEADCQGTTVRKTDGTAGDDTLTGTDAPEALFGLAGNDTANGAGGNDCVNGDEGRDRLFGGAGKDTVKGGAGKDRVSGQGGKDKLKGNAGRDNLNGGGGKDRLSGGGGKDRLRGGGGKDRLKGGPGKDKIVGGGGKDRINCGGGRDKVIAQAKDKVSNNCEKVVEKG